MLWTKLIINCAYNALSAITTLPYGKLVQHAGVEQVLGDIVDECLAVAKKAGVTPVGDVREGVQRIPRTMPNQTSSTAQDLKRGRRSEIDHLNGIVFVDHLSQLKQGRIKSKLAKQARVTA